MNAKLHAICLYTIKLPKLSFIFTRVDLSSTRREYRQHFAWTTNYSFSHISVFIIIINYLNFKQYLLIHQLNLNSNRLL